MTSSGPYTQALARTHMWSFVDRRGPYSAKKPSYDEMLGEQRGHGRSPSSLMAALDRIPALSTFKRIVERAGMRPLLESSQAEITLFAPVNGSYGEWERVLPTLRVGTARVIVNASILPIRLPEGLLRGCPVCTYNGRGDRSRMYVDNLCGVTEINRIATVVEYDVPNIGNGVLHLTHGVVLPLKSC